MTDSKTKVKRAGRVFREWTIANPNDANPPQEIEDAIRVVQDYRGSFAVPLLSVRMSLSSFAKTVGQIEAIVAQRHKRLDRIVNKLIRYPRMQLTTMQDIGGCRIVVPTSDGVHQIASHASRRWRTNITKLDDYIATPKPSGYRAIHIVVQRGGRPIEVQIRTRLQHKWADGVESLSRSRRVEFKWGDGDADMKESLKVVAEAFAEVDAGEGFSDELRAKLVHYGTLPGGSE